MGNIQTQHVAFVNALCCVENRPVPFCTTPDFSSPYFVKIISSNRIIQVLADASASISSNWFLLEKIHIRTGRNACRFAETEASIHCHSAAMSSTSPAECGIPIALDDFLTINAVCTPGAASLLRQANGWLLR